MSERPDTVRVQRAKSFARLWAPYLAAGIALTGLGVLPKLSDLYRREEAEAAHLRLDRKVEKAQATADLAIEAVHKGQIEIRDLLLTVPSVQRAYKKKNGGR
jgi:hypothetical protein